MSIQQMRKRMPASLLMLYQRMLMQQWSQIDKADIAEQFRKVQTEAEFMKIRAENMGQKVTMLMEIVNNLPKDYK